MSYTPTIWQNSPSTATPISADNLNHIEQGIADLDDQLNGANGIVQELQTAELNIQSLDENKVSKEEGKDLSSNDFTDDDVAKLDGIEAGAEVNVQSDYAQEDTTADDYIKNKPTSSEKSATSSFKTINGGLLTKCIVDITPKQDLHGYEYPWVGGAGKNLFEISGASSPVTQNDVTISRVTDTDGNIIGVKVNGTASADCSFTIYGKGLGNDFNAIKGKTLKVYGGSNCNSNLYIQGASSNGLWGNDTTGNGSSAFTVESTEPNNWNCQIIVKNGTAVDNKIIYPMLCLSSDSSTFASYTNYCSISGHTEVDIKRNGGNQLPMVIDDIKSANTDGTWSGNTYTFNGASFTLQTNSLGKLESVMVNGTPSADSTLFIPFGQMPVGDYLASGGCDGGGALKYDVYFWDKTTSSRLKKWDGTTESVALYNSSATAQIKVQNSSDNMQYRIRIKANVSVSNLVFYPNILKASDIQTYIINLNGTYYGGTVDFVSGVMTGTYAIIDDASTLGWYAYDNAHNIFAVSIVGKANGNTNVISSAYSTTTETPVQNMSDGTIRGGDSNTIYVRNTQYSDATDFRASMENVQICYELATPQTIQLTPTQIESLAGVNYIDTPLDGQSIETDGVGYKELFGWDDVVNYVQSIVNQGE